jgi:uncharacterized YigZ family protein
MTETYWTVAARAQADFEVKGSEFIGHVAPAESVAEAEAFVDEVRAAYADATHNVPAYRVPAEGGDMLREWSSDDGEPTGSAGKPALNVLVQRDLRHVVAVVTRYYGGVNLGVGGLARAYARGVSDAVDAAGTIEERPHERVAVTVDYDDSGTVRGILESEAVDFEAAYEERVSFDVRVPVAEADALRDRLRSATGGRVELG